MHSAGRLPQFPLQLDMISACGSIANCQIVEVDLLGGRHADSIRNHVVIGIVAQHHFERAAMDGHRGQRLEGYSAEARPAGILTLVCGNRGHQSAAVVDAEGSIGGAAA